MTGVKIKNLLILLVPTGFKWSKQGLFHYDIANIVKVSHDNSNIILLSHSGLQTDNQLLLVKKLLSRYFRIHAYTLEPPDFLGTIPSPWTGY